jgi:hypothetical protein
MPTDGQMTQATLRIVVVAAIKRLQESGQEWVSRHDLHLALPDMDYRTLSGLLNRLQHQGALDFDFNAGVGAGGRISTGYRLRQAPQRTKPAVRVQSFAAADSRSDASGELYRLIGRLEEIAAALGGLARRLGMGGDEGGLTSRDSATASTD